MELSLEDLIQLASPHIREITFHSDGRVIAKTGARSPKPKKLYNSNAGGTIAEKTKSAVFKLLKDNVPTIL